MANPNPLPSNLKKLRGTYRKDRAAINEMVPAAIQEIPLAPERLDKKGQEVWYTVAMELKNLNMFHQVDLEMLGAYCYQIQIMHEAMYYIEKNGKILTLTNKASAQYYQKNPWIAIYNEALGQANRLAQQFGFTPSSRSKINAPVKKEEEADPWGDL